MQFWQALQTLSTADAAQLAVAGLSAVGTLAAAVAAWRAAKSTRATVEEMREARLQSVRPAFDVQVPDRLILRIGGERSVSLEAERDTEQPVITLTNIADSSALSVTIDYVSGPDQSFSGLGIQEIEELLARGGFSLLGNHEDYRSLRSTGHPGGRTGVGFRAIGTVPTAKSAIASGEPMTIGLLQNSFIVGALDILARQAGAEREERDWDAYSEALTMFDRLQVNYSTLAGENHKAVFAIVVRPWLAVHTSSNGDRTYSPSSGVWRTIEISFAVDVIKAGGRDETVKVGFSRLRLPTSVRGFPYALDTALRDGTFSST